MNIRDGREKLKELPAEERKQIDLLYGHVSYGWHHHLPRPTRYITVIRHPISRIVSHYNYVRYRAEAPHYLRDIVNNNDMSIKEYVESGVCDEMNNGQVRLISGVEDIVQQPFGDSKVEYGTNEEALLDSALTNIENHFDMVGVQERFNESLLLICRRMNLNLPSYRPRNVGRKHYEKRQPTAEDIRAIREYNQLDFSLYESVRDRFETEFSDLAFPKTRTYLFQLRNRCVNCLRSARQSVRSLYS